MRSNPGCGLLLPACIFCCVWSVTITTADVWRTPPVSACRLCASAAAVYLLRHIYNHALPAHLLLHALMYHQFVGQQPLLLLHCLPAARTAVRQRRQEGLPYCSRCRRGYCGHRRVVGRDDVCCLCKCMCVCWLFVCASVSVVSRDLLVWLPCAECCRHRSWCRSYRVCSLCVSATAPGTRLGWLPSSHVLSDAQSLYRLCCNTTHKHGNSGNLR